MLLARWPPLLLLLLLLFFAAKDLLELTALLLLSLSASSETNLAALKRSSTYSIGVASRGGVLPITPLFY